jgi:hypothetical protein
MLSPTQRLGGWGRSLHTMEPESFVFALSNGGPLRMNQLSHAGVATGDPGRRVGGPSHS